MYLTIKQLRLQAITSAFFTPTTLRRAIERFGFVQADPIRSPARAQDLILRHRVKNYKAGDLEKQYPKIRLEEDFLYAYGFMPQSTWQLLHPRTTTRLSITDKRILEIVSNHKKIHPAELEAYLGRKRTVNAWGGYSKMTTKNLQNLQYRGFLRIAGRQDGIRLYEAVSTVPEWMDPAERLEKLVLLIAAILAPVPEASLRATLRHLAYASPSLAGRKSIVGTLLTSGALTSGVADGIKYLWPSGKLARKKTADLVRFLAPFDPLVWDRRRFEHLWGWPYRFEAYTPPAKRKLGYYSMPLLWRDDIIGWVNISNNRGDLIIKPGYMKDVPADPSFASAFEMETEKFRHFMESSE
ncbi:MAG: crosslink repair DNA glycosylase YcaQ family protein [Chitinophagaceae bacterium]